MRVLLLSTQNTNCDLAGISSLVNAVQFFFFTSYRSDSLVFEQDLVSAPLMKPQAVLAWLKTKLSGIEGSDSADLVILLTGAVLALPPRRSVWRAGEVAIVTSHHWTEPAEFNRRLRFARHILQLGLSFIVKHSSGVRSCIAGAAEDFDCICALCQAELKALGFRDGIAHLKNTFNTLNQLQSGGDATLVQRTSNLLDAELKLAKQYVEEFRQEGISLRGITILVVLHFLSDLVPFLKALNNLGAEYKDIYLVAKSYPYSRRDEVAQILECLGVNVWRASKILSPSDCARRVLMNLNDRCDKSIPRRILEFFGVKGSQTSVSRLLVIEDGGYFAPILHEPEFSSLLARCIGVVEQTTKGINEDRKIEALSVPILSVAESSFKKNYESPEIGRVALQNISRFTPNIKLSGQNALLFGFGSVGQQIAVHLTNSFNMTVSVVESSPLALLVARHRKMIVAEAAATFGELAWKRPSLVIGTTGGRSITEEILTALPSGCVVVSTSSDQVEIDLAALEKMSHGRWNEVEEGKTIYAIGPDNNTKNIVLLAEGYPINFYGSDSLPNDTIDPVMTLLLLCAVELSLGRKFKPIIDLEAVDKIVRDRSLVEKFLELQIVEASG